MKQLANSIPPIHHSKKREAIHDTEKKGKIWGGEGFLTYEEYDHIASGKQTNNSIPYARKNGWKDTLSPKKNHIYGKKTFLVGGIVRLAKISTYRAGNVHFSPTRRGGGGVIPQTSSTAAGPPVKTISFSIWENDVASSYIRLQMQSTLSASKRRESV